MDTQLENRARAINLVAGAILITLGFLFLAGQLLRIDFGHFLWPFFIIVPGIALFLFAVLNRSSLGEPLSMASGVITMAGMLMLYQNLTGHWASWAYAWALVAPTGVGLGLLAYGAIKGQPDKVKAGANLATIGVVIFLFAAVFFEFIIGVSGFGLGRLGWPVLLIGLGLIGLIRAFFPRRTQS